jgi:hypothetical protein
MAVQDIMAKIKENPEAFAAVKVWLSNQTGEFNSAIYGLSESPQLSSIFDSKFINYFCSDYANDNNFDYSESYSYGMKHPEEFLDDDPLGPDGEYTDDQKEEAAQKAEEAAMDYEITEFARNFNNNWDNSREFKREMVSKFYDKVVIEYLNTEYYANESFFTIDNLLTLLQTFYAEEGTEDFEDFEDSLGITPSNPFEGDPMFSE